jgi:3-methylfumaryl-CoA hydratase
MSAGELQESDVNDWVGRSQTTHDEITAFPLTALAASLGREDARATVRTTVPPLWHWLYFLPTYPPEEMRHDGHAKGGEFTPPISLPRRVWAGSKFTWNVDNPLRVGDKATRISRIGSITPKQGSSGKLVFLKLIHEFHNESGLCLTNEHQSVYREAPKADRPASAPEVAETQSDWHRVLTPDPVLLFRYSALTFNSHRIHYDAPYAVNEEKYPGLLVQGPLTSTLLADLLRRFAPQSLVRSFELKAVRSSYVNNPLHLRGSIDGGRVRLWAADDDGYVTMTASAEIAS